jgi:hypothetical protein
MSSGADSVKIDLGYPSAVPPVSNLPLFTASEASTYLHIHCDSHLVAIGFEPRMIKERGAFSETEGGCRSCAGQRRT